MENNKGKEVSVVEKVMGTLSENKLFDEVTDVDFSESEKVKGFAKVYGYVKEIHDSSEDINIEDASAGMKVIPDEEKLLMIEVKDGRMVPLSSDGLSSLSSSFNLNSGYIKKCLENDMYDLAAENINRWIEKSDKGRLLRLTDGRVDAVLSDRYSVFDDIDLLDTISPVFKSLDTNFLIKNKTVSPGIMKLRLVSENKIVVGPDELSLGIDIKNSRIGRSSIDVSFMLFRWACSNGMIFGRQDVAAFKRIHVGNVSELSNELTGVIELLPGKIDEVTETANYAYNKMLDYKDVRNIGSMMKSESLPKQLRDSYQEAYINEAIESSVRMWDIINFLTHESKIYGVTSREKIEKMAGYIYTMGRK